MVCTHALQQDKTFHLFGIYVYLCLWLVGRGYCQRGAIEGYNDNVIVKQPDFRWQQNLLASVPGSRFTSIGEWAKVYGGHSYDYLHIVSNQTYARLSYYEDNQCIEVQNSWLISRQVCTLPPYCGQTVYSIIKRSNWWLVEVGLCMGVGETIITNIDPIGARIPIGWCEVIKVLPYNNSKFYWYYTLYILKCETEYYTIPEQFILHHPRMDSNLLMIAPLLVEMQGRYCIPSITDSKYPILFGPFKTQEAAADYSMFFYTDVKIKSSPSFCIDYYTCYDHTKSKFDNTTHSMTIVCDVFKQTANTLPFSYSYFTLLVGNMAYTVLRSVYDLVVAGIYYFIVILLKFIDPFTFVLFASYSYIYSSRSLFDVVLASLLISFAVNYLLTPRNVHYQGHSFLVRPNWMGF